MKKIICILAVIFTLFNCAGCGDADNSETALKYNAAFILGIANYNTVVNTNTIDVLCDISGLPGSAYTIIECDGSPYVISSGEIADYTDRGYTAKMLERIQASVQADIADQIASTIPKTDEVDVASAVSLSVRSIRANQEDGRQNVLVLYMSGLSTTGIINFAETAISQINVETSVKSAVAAMNLDLSGIDVIWYCLGDTFEEQSGLSSNEVEILRTFYENLFLEMGAESVTFMQDLPSNEGYKFEEQYVSIIETEAAASVLAATVITYPDSADDVQDALENGDILSLSISFLPDSTELADYDEASETLSNIIEYMSQHPDFNLLIVGTTASVGSEENCIEFSLRRTETIKGLLMNKGVDEERIYILGAGYSNKILYVPDRNEDGTLNENSQLNRQVVLVNYDSATAAQIINAQ